MYDTDIRSGRCGSDDLIISYSCNTVTSNITTRQRRRAIAIPQPSTADTFK